MRMKRILPALFVGLAFIGLLRLAGEAAAQPEPQDQQEVLKTMVQWNQDLGVSCDYCHTSDKTQTIESLEGKTASSQDLQALLHRRIAQDMQGMMQMVNQQQSASITCNTCHQGSAKIEGKK